MKVIAIMITLGNPINDIYDCLFIVSTKGDVYFSWHNPPPVVFTYGWIGDLYIFQEILSSKFASSAVVSVQFTIHQPVSIGVIDADWPGLARRTQIPSLMKAFALYPTII